MEFFALNLCVQLVEAEQSPFYDFPSIDWDSMLHRFETDNLFEGQSFYLNAEDNASLLIDLFEFQCNNTYRQKNVKVVVRFRSRPELEAFRFDFLNFFKVEVAAGGVVQNEKHEILFIGVQNYWTLPKGHIKKGEPLEIGAVREVCEETGLVNPSVEGKLSVSYHTYLKKEKWRWKETHWFAMHESSNALLQPQVEENIHTVVWFDKSLWLQNMDKTFNQHKEILRKFYYKV